MLVDLYGNAILPKKQDLDLTEILSKSNIEKVNENEARRRGQWFSNYGPNVTNIGSLNGTLRKPLDTPPFAMLRQVVRDSLIDRAIVSRRVEDIKGLSRKIVVSGKQKGWRVVHKRFDDPNFDSSDPKIQRRCREMEKIIESPSRLYHKTFRDFLTVAVQEELVIDRRAMVVNRDSKGRPVEYYLLPGDTILPVLYVLMPWMARRGITNERVARMILSEEYSQKSGLTIDITEAAYVQEVDGQVVGAWKEDEIDVEWSNPSGELNRWGFGVSLLEQSLQATSLLLNMFNFNKDLFRPGFPSRMLVLSGDYSAEGLATFERQILGQGGPASPKSKMPVLPGPENMRAQVLDLTNNPGDMQFEQFFRLMSCVKCSFFGMHPSRLNLSENNPQGLVMGSGSATSEVSKTVNEEGLYAILESNADWLTRTLIQPHYDDLILIFDGLHEESEAVVLQSLQMESAWSTKNEIRARRNLPPLSDMEGGEVINDGVWLQWVSLKKQEKQQEDAKKEYEKGNFGGGQPGQPGQQGPDGGQPGQDGGQPPQGGGDPAAMMAQMMGGGQQPDAGGQQPPDAGGQQPPDGSQSNDQQPANAPQQGQAGQGSLPDANSSEDEQPAGQALTPSQIREILSKIGRSGRR
ncbi:hypothetical protein EBS67_00550 [bacterium]|nr:hypothetical protein [bacterium]NBT60759.1 hypothetical protein [Planctomycetia bacterium]